MDKVECNTCEYCLSSPLYRGVCTKVEPNHIFTEDDRQRWFIHGQKPDWCPLKMDNLRLRIDRILIEGHSHLIPGYTPVYVRGKIINLIKEALDGLTVMGDEALDDCYFNPPTTIANEFPDYREVNHHIAESQLSHTIKELKERLG